MILDLKQIAVPQRVEWSHPGRIGYFATVEILVGCSRSSIVFYEDYQLPVGRWTSTSWVEPYRLKWWCCKNWRGCKIWCCCVLNCSSSVDHFVVTQDRYLPTS